MSTSKYKVYKDAVHGTIKLPQIIFDMIDTAQFQRLRRIKQMGGKYFVYTGTSHNRFEHSIGVCYLAGEFLRTLRDNHNGKEKDLEITDKDILCVQIAGLCHDLGHGPYSHVFDSMVTPNLLEGANKTWKHEDGSVHMFEHMIRQPLKGDTCLRSVLETQECFDESDFTFIKEAILGCPIGVQHADAANEPMKYAFEGRPREKWFLYEIVNNKFTSTDVDKWDYFARDCHEVGLSYDFDWKQYISVCKVLHDKGLDRRTICPMDREVMVLYDMFHAREMLHRKALKHVTCVSIELMIADALLEACKVLESHLKLDIKLALRKAESATDEVDMSIYQQFDDTILQTVSFYETYDDKIRTKHVTNLLQRISSRDLYVMVGSVVENTADSSDDEWKRNAKRIKERLIKYLKDEKFTRDDYEVYVVKFDYGMQNRDPLELLRAYRKEDVCPLAQPLTYEMKSRMLPRAFEEKYVRLYCKKPSLVDTLKGLFSSWCESNGLTQRMSVLSNSDSGHNSSKV